MPGDSLYKKACMKLYGWTSSDNIFAELAKTAAVLPASAACAIGADSWMGDYVRGGGK